MNLILASTSPYRKALMNKLGLTFSCQAPHIDETPIAGESAVAMVERLAREKALAVAASLQPDDTGYLVIGSDQVACENQHILGKPHTVERAVAQLTRFSGKKVSFYTGLAIHNSLSGHTSSLVEPFDVHFRQLSERQIRAYVDREQPLDCAGSFKSEGLGISLFDAFEGRDPNSLVGLPMMALVDLLAQQGLDVLNPDYTNSNS